MKTMKLLGIIALVAIFALGMISCDLDDLCDPCDYEWTEITPATITTIGEEEGICPNCADTVTRQIIDPALLGKFTDEASTQYVDVTRTTLYIYNPAREEGESNPVLLDFEIVSWEKISGAGASGHSVGYKLTCVVGYYDTPTYTVGEVDLFAESNNVELFYTTNGGKVQLKFGSSGIPSTRIYAK